MDGFEGGFARPPPVPKMVQDFVVYFYRHIRERNIREIYTMYSHTFPHLSERFFKGTAWPAVEVIAPLVEQDHVFCLLYKEMYYRHLHAAGAVPLDARLAAWHTYRELFHLVLTSTLNMQLPNGWLWDMVDEFVYQFQSYRQYAGKVAARGGDDAEALRAAGGAWDAAAVLAVLSQLVAASGIREELAASGGVEALYESEGYSASRSNVLRMLGYFSLAGLLRVHAVLGDYPAALAAIRPLNPFQRKSMFATKMAMCSITLFYYCGFSYLMLGRYLDAARCFNFVLSYIASVKGATQRAPGGAATYEQMLKKNEQMYALLAVASALCPAAGSALDEAVANQLREKYGEKMRQMSGGAADTFEELFAYACPKFVAVGDAAPGANANMEAYGAQLRPFMAVVTERRHLPAIKQFLKLYSSITVAKLASLAEMDEAGVKEQLDLLRAASTVITWSGGDLLTGSPQPAGDVEFSLERQEGQEMVVVAEPKAQAVRGSELLLRHITKLGEIVADLERLGAGPLAQPAPAAGAPSVAAH